MFWFALASKLVITAVIVVGAASIAERAGPLIGALVVTLPVVIAPAYIFLAMDHDAAYIASSAATSLAATPATAAFMLLYVLLAQRRSLLVSLGCTLPAWFVLVGLARPDWPLYGTGLLNVAVFVACLKISRTYRDVAVPLIERRWYELPLRVVLVCLLIGGVLVLSRWAGPQATGIMSMFPLSTISTMLILHARLGGRVAAAVIANGLWGVLGIAIGLFTVAATAPAWGNSLAIAVGLLAFPLIWNMSVWYLRRRGARLA